MMNSSTSDGCEGSTADFQFYLLPAAYVLAVTLGLLGNLGALYVFIFRISPKSPSNIYIINLALADTAFLCSLPFRIHYHLNQNHWVFSELVCRITGMIFHANVYISIAFMTCICVDRYIATVHPHTYLRLRHTHCATLVSVAMWLVSTAIVLPFILAGPFTWDVGTVGTGKSERKSCFENFSQEQWNKHLAPYSACSLVFGALLPSVVILVCYPLVLRRISRIRSATARGAQRVIYAILAITLVCFLPYHVVHLLHLLRRMQVIRDCPWADGIYKARRVTMALVSLNSMLDPLLYFFATRHCKWSWKWKWPKPKRSRAVYSIATRL